MTEALGSSDSLIRASVLNLPTVPVEQVRDCHDDQGRNVLHLLAKDPDASNKCKWIGLLKHMRCFHSLAIAQDFAGQRPIQTAAASANKQLVLELRQSPMVRLSELFDCTSGATAWRKKKNWLKVAAFPDWEGVIVDEANAVIALGLENNGLSGMSVFANDFAFHKKYVDRYNIIHTYMK